jgi:hypothetical protein
MGVYVLMCLLKKAASVCVARGKSHANTNASAKFNIPAKANRIMRELVISTISRGENPDLYEEEFIHERDMCNYNYFN